MWLPPIKPFILYLFSILYTEVNVSATDTIKHDGGCYSLAIFQQHQTGKKYNFGKLLD
jgi:hypothetical protein